MCIRDSISPGSDGCYWERLSGLSGEFSDVITNGSGQGQQYVQIASTDVAFSSSRCASWRLAGGVPVPAPPPSRGPQPVPDGLAGPRPGDGCSDANAVTRDPIGQTMWCNPTMTGDHSLVWMYGGPE